jgi:hypothetical protein
VTLGTGRLQLLTMAELAEQPPPEWLIAQVFETGANVLLYGAPGEGKTFLALDWALSIATGTPWQGREVKQGPVVYIAGEGGTGILKRARAWAQHHGMSDIPEAFFMIEAPQLRGDGRDLELLLQRIAAANRRPKMIAIDTLARSFVGGDENSATDMGEFNESVRRLQRETEATILTLHHSGKPREGRAQDARGSSALKGAVDTQVRVSKSGDDRLSIACEKQKDHEEFAEIHVAMQQVVVGTDASGLPITSCVLVPANARPAKARLNDTQERLLSVLAGEMGATIESQVWQEAAAAAGLDIAERTFFAHAKALVAAGHVARTAKGAYAITAAGAATAGELQLRHWGATFAAATAPPPKGVQ